MEEALNRLKRQDLPVRGKDVARLPLVYLRFAIDRLIRRGPPEGPAWKNPSTNSLAHRVLLPFRQTTTSK